MDLMVTVAFDTHGAPESRLDAFAAGLPAAVGAAYALGDSWMDVTLTAPSVEAGRAFCAGAADAAGLSWTVRTVTAEHYPVDRA